MQVHDAHRRLSASSTFCCARARTRPSSARISFRKSVKELAAGSPSNSALTSFAFEKLAQRGSEVERPIGRYAAWGESAFLLSGAEMLRSGDFEGDLALLPRPGEKPCAPSEPRLVLGLVAR
jgi:hypothetical protein